MILRQFAAAALAGFVVIMSCYSAVGMRNDALVATGAAAGTRGHRGPSTSTAVVVAASAALLATSPAVNPGVAPFDGATGAAVLRGGELSMDDDGDDD